MNRNIKRMQDKLFGLLTKHTEIERSDYPNARLYLTKEEYDTLGKDVLPKETLSFGKNQIVSIYEYKNKYYLIAPDDYESSTISSLSPIDDIKEIIFVHIVENEISALEIATKIVLEEYILLEENVQNIQWEQINQYFPKFILFQINESVPLVDTEIHSYLRQLCIALVCNTKKLHQLPYEDDTISGFIEISNSINKNIPYDNVLRSLLSSDWRLCFIDLYTCQERLLMLAWVEEFKTSLCSPLSLSDLHGKMKKRYKTEHHECENMRTLYNFLPNQILDLLNENEKPEKKADHIYTLRNTIVHFQRSNDLVSSKSDSEWNMIVRFILNTIPFLYDKFNQHIMELKDL